MEKAKLDSLWFEMVQTANAVGVDPENIVVAVVGSDDVRIVRLSSRAEWQSLRLVQEKGGLDALLSALWPTCPPDVKRTAGMVANFVGKLARF